MKCMLKIGSIAEFVVKKQFKYIRPLGSGGTGDTHLFEDETTEMLFAFKKYVSKDSRFIDEYYRRFVDEIKILFRLSHSNIVRVYNYYLYPDKKLGYLQMEYIDGVSIDEYNPNGWGKDWNSILTDVVSAFEYLELNKVLHRDIRPANILINNNGNVKIIDFGFGKQLENVGQNCGSVFLNWPVSELPEEVQFNQEYNHKTEIYFVGKLFQKLVKNNLTNFKFNHIIEKMIKLDPTDRYESFSDVSKAISAGVLGEISFEEHDKDIYINFANVVLQHISYYSSKYTPINDVKTTLESLAELIRDSCLERYIQDNSRLINCFISNGYNYRTLRDIDVICVKDFYQFLVSLDSVKQKIVLDNIYTRLSQIKVRDEEEIPF